MRADNDAVKAKYESVAALASKVFVVEAPHDTELPYAVLYPMGGQDTTDRLNGTGPRISRPLAASSADVMAFVVAGGVTTVPKVAD